MKKLFILAAAMLTGFSAWAALPLSPLSADTTFFTSDFWGETVSKNTVIYNQSNQFMMLTQGNQLSFGNDMMYIGNSSKVSAFVFNIADAADLTLAVDQNNGSVATVTLYYLGTDTPEELSSSNVSVAGTKTCGAITLSAAGLQELTAKGCEAGYYKVVGSLRFAIKYIAKAAPSAADHTKASLIGIKLDDIALAGFTAEQLEYTVELEFDATAAPVVSAETADDATLQITQAPAVPGDAVVVCTSYDGSETITYTIHFTKEAESPIIRAKHTGATTADVKGTIGGTVDKNTQAGGKLGSNGHYFGIQLAEGNFLAGDSLVIVATLNGGNTATLFADNAGTIAIAEAEFDVTTGICSYVLTEEVSAIYLVRLTSACNPTVTMMQVYRSSEGPSTGIDTTNADTKAVKVIRNGQVHILRGEKVYTITGQEVK